MAQGKEQTVYHQLAGPIVFDPVFQKLEKKSVAHTQTLKDSFAKVEEQYPGFSQDFLMGLLKSVGLESEIDVSETFLRMAALSDSTTTTTSRIPQIQRLELRALSLKKLLGQIPNEITERRKFLEAIKQIANAIKNLLDSVSDVISHLPQNDKKTNLELQKREFVRYSKRFSGTLKAFFKENRPSEVFSSANLLVHQTNLILLFTRDASDS